MRGERAHPYLDGGVRRTVCELCIARAHQEGWIREGTVPAYAGRQSGSERRRSLLHRLRRRREDAVVAGVPETTADLEPLTTPPAAPARTRTPLREPRHVRAVPAGAEQRIAGAIAAFNSSQHPRTVAGVARSLGVPSVSVTPARDHPSIVRLVVAWELCWYRYEVELAHGPGSVQQLEQGYELDELPPEERQPNAAAEDNGTLSFA